MLDWNQKKVDRHHLNWQEKCSFSIWHDIVDGRAQSGVCADESAAGPSSQFASAGDIVHEDEPGAGQSTQLESDADIVKVAAEEEVLLSTCKEIDWLSTCHWWNLIIFIFDFEQLIESYIKFE